MFKEIMYLLKERKKLNDILMVETLLYSKVLFSEVYDFINNKEVKITEKDKELTFLPNESNELFDLVYVYKNKSGKHKKVWVQYKEDKTVFFVFDFKKSLNYNDLNFFNYPISTDYHDGHYYYVNPFSMFENRDLPECKMIEVLMGLSFEDNLLEKKEEKKHLNYLIEVESSMTIN